MINQQFFQKHQKLIVWFANTKIGKWYFRFEKYGNNEKGEIIAVYPNATTHENGNEKKTVFFIRNEYALRLSKLLFWKPVIESITPKGLPKVLRPAYQILFLILMAKVGLIALTTSTFNPNKDPESTTVDGIVGQTYTLGSGVDWATITGAAGNFGTNQDSDTDAYALGITADNTTDNWKFLFRGIFLFDCTTLGADTIDSATFSLYGHSKTDTAGRTPNVNVYSSNPASNTAMADGDFDSLGNTAFCDTAIAYGDWNESGYNDFAFNASGLAAITAGIVKLGTRNANYDVAGSPPTWSSGESMTIQAKFADNATNKPKLVVVHTSATTTSSSTTTTVTTTTSTSTSSSTSTTTTLDPTSGGLAFGEEIPTEGETAVTWVTFSDGSGGNPTISGDSDWGKLTLSLNDEGRSKVYCFGDENQRNIEVTNNKYGTGQGSATTQIRGQATVFLQDDVSPDWETYTIPVAKTWKYIQVRAIKNS